MKYTNDKEFEKLCFATTITDTLVLANETTGSQEMNKFSCDMDSIKVGTDDCATHHVC